MLAGREGEVFDAVVVDEDRRGAMIQLVEPAVLARVDAHRVDPGDDVRVRLTARRRRRSRRRIEFHARRRLIGTPRWHGGSRR